MEEGIMALGLLQEAKAGARIHDDWERDYRALEAREAGEQFKLAIRATLVKFVALFRGPVPMRRAAQA